MDERLAIRVGMWAQVVPVEKIWGQCAGQWNSRWLRKWVRPRNFPDGGRAGDPSLIRSPVGQMWDSLNAASLPHNEVICGRPAYLEAEMQVGTRAGTLP